MGSAGGVVAQPALGRAADLYGYATSYLIASGIQALAVPFAVLTRRTNASSDPITADIPEPPVGMVVPADRLPEPPISEAAD
jgi:hypothetical protein